MRMVAGRRELRREGGGEGYAECVRYLFPASLPPAEGWEALGPLPPPHLYRGAALEPSLLDPRAVLKRVLKRLGALGYTAKVGVELEFYLLNPDGSPATAESLRVIKAMLHRGYILLPEGEHGNIISFTPPLTTTETQLDRMVNELEKILNHAERFLLLLLIWNCWLMAVSIL